jgi:hypothetical protein
MLWALYWAIFFKQSSGHPSGEIVSMSKMAFLSGQDPICESCHLPDFDRPKKVLAD